MRKSFSPSCDRNKTAILEVLKDVITKDNSKLLEVGSGTGQHASFFAAHFPNIEWHTSDLVCNHLTINSNISESNLTNIKAPISYEVGKDSFPKTPFDLLFSANTFHIMSWKKVKTLIKAFGGHLRPGSQVVIYGPFNYDGNFTSKSNEAFDHELKQKDPKSGIRSFEDVDKQMKDQGFTLSKDYEMPANNRALLYFRTPRLDKEK